jgi:hypothetical protein
MHTISETIQHILMNYICSQQLNCKVTLILMPVACLLPYTSHEALGIYIFFQFLKNVVS